MSGLSGCSLFSIHSLIHQFKQLLVFHQVAARRTTLETALHSIEDSMLWVTTSVTPTDQLRFRGMRGVRSFEANTPDVNRAMGR